MAGSSGVNLRALVFNEENFDFWQIKMKTIFRSHDLWDMVEMGYNHPAKREEELTATKLKLLKENTVKDAKALDIIQGVVLDEIFPRITILEMEKEDWDILKQDFIRDKQVRSMKLQSEHEAFSVYIVRLLDLITQMKSYGEDIGNQRIVQKLLISLPKSYDSIVAVIENTRDLEIVDVQDVVATLKGHFAKDCKSKKATQHANYVGQVENNPTMFYVCMTAAVNKGEDIWYVDSGCSNHMTGREDLLVNIDRNVIAKVEMGTGQLVDVVGNGDLLVETKQAKRYIREIMLVLGLKENLLSVRQMMEHGYCLLFGGIEVRIYDDFTCSNLVVKIPIKGNRSFPLKLQPRIQIVMRVNVGQVAEIWHRRLGHLNMNALMQLQECDMVTRLPELKMNTTMCEGCALGKHSRDAFPKETKWKATIPLELIHTDICGPMQTPSVHCET
ncbi:unnamed protein product [Malus baccata var. baccata]